MDAHRFPVSLGLALTASGALLAVAAAPGWLAPEIGSTIRSAYSVLCHQLPDRSPHIGGGTWALCHRCTGIAAGLVLGLATTPLLSRRLAMRLTDIPPGRALAASLVPLVLDWTLGATGIWANTPLSRVVTGAVFGVVAGLVLALALRPSARAPLSSPNLLSA